MSEPFDYRELDGILDSHGRKESAIIAIMQEIQEHWRYLPPEVFPYLSKQLNMSEARIYGVATFYENFSLEPKGKYVVRVCDGTACHVRRSAEILTRLKRDLALRDGKKTTSDRLFTLETVSCLGACGLAPVITVNGTVHPSMTPDKASEIIKQLREEEEKNA